jgi:hypothetical protein
MTTEIASQGSAAPARAPRIRRWAVVAAVVIIVVAAIIVSVLLWPSSSNSTWKSLPNPASQASNSGQTVGEGGGQGSGSISLPSSTPAGNLSLLVACRGAGTLRMTIGGSTSSVQCFSGSKSAAYKITTASKTAANSLAVETGAKVQWRVVLPTP